MNYKTESEFREQIISLIGEYYEQFHRPQIEKPFIPGETKVNYAGRIYGSQEMQNLGHSLLDFWLTSGRYYEEFEKKLAAFLGLKYALLVNSGSSANLLAFSALTSPLLKERQLHRGDEVITVAAGFPTTVNPIVQNGMIPVFVDVDVDQGTYNIDIDKLPLALSKKTKAVMIAHTLGNPFNLDAVKEFCDRNGLWLIEDNCDALGSRYKGKLTGTFGDLATSSFYPPHHITMGEGGAVYTNNPLLKRIVESFRDWGRDCWCPSGKDNTCKKRFNWQLGDLPSGYDHKYIYSHFGYNLKATEMQASIGLAQLDRIEDFALARRNNFGKLLEDCKLHNLDKYLILPRATQHSEPSWFGFPLTVRNSSPINRDQIVRFLETKGIQTRMLFAGNLLRQPLFDEMRQSDSGFRVIGQLTNTDRIACQTFWLGVYPGLDQPRLEWITKCLKEAFED